MRRWLSSLLLLGLLAASPVAAEPPHISASGDPAAARIQFDWPAPASGPVGVTAEQEGRSLLLRFDRPLETADPTTIMTALPDWVAGIAHGYDSVLIEARHDVSFDVQAVGGRVEIALGPPPVTAAPPLDPQTARRLERLAAQAAAGTGERALAADQLTALAADDPGDADTLLALAEVQAGRGNWRAAVDAYERARLLRPNDAWIARARADLLATEGPYLRVGTTLRSVEGGETQLIAEADGRIDLTPSLQLGAAIDGRRIEADLVQRRDGSRADVDRHVLSGEVFLDRRWATDSDIGQSTRAHVFAGDHGLGAGLSHRTRIEIGEAEARLTWREPERDRIEGLSDAGHRSSLGLSLSADPAPRLSVSLGGALVSHGRGDEDDLARSARLQAGARVLLRQDSPGISLGYALDADYALETETRSDAQGLRFEPVPIESRETHLLDVSAFGRFDTDLRWGVLLGWSVDRFGGNGPTLAGEIAWRIADTSEIGLRLARSETTSANNGSTSGATTSAGLFLRIGLAEPLTPLTGIGDGS